MVSESAAPRPQDDAVVAQRLTALDTVRARILLAIELGTLAPGDRIVPAREFAAGMDVSAMTARRALESLVDDGVLVRRRGRGGGTFVADAPASPASEAVDAFRADTRSVEQLVSRRVLMECGIVALAAANGTAEDWERAQRAVDACAESADWAAFHRADRAFHLAVADAAHLPAADEYRAVLVRLHAYFMPFPIEHLHASNDEHRDVLSALRHRDVATAVEATRRHVEALQREMFFAADRS